LSLHGGSPGCGEEVRLIWAAHVPEWNGSVIIVWFQYLYRQIWDEDQEFSKKIPEMERVHGMHSNTG
jgi:hypothetical protein